QTAYEILVASNEKQLAHGEGNLWTSGKVDSDRSIHIRYAGKPLASNQECFWKVRVWDASGHSSSWSAPAKWTVGLLDASDWHGQWIGKEESERTSNISGTSWIWYPEAGINPADKAPIGRRYFRKTFELPSNQKVISAEWLVTGDNHFTASVNGTQIGSGSNF